MKRTCDVRILEIPWSPKHCHKTDSLCTVWSLLCLTAFRNRRPRIIKLWCKLLQYTKPLQSQLWEVCKLEALQHLPLHSLSALNIQTHFFHVLSVIKPWTKHKVQYAKNTMLLYRLVTSNYLNLKISFFELMAVSLLYFQPDKNATDSLQLISYFFLFEFRANKAADYYLGVWLLSVICPGFIAPLEI